MTDRTPDPLAPRLVTEHGFLTPLTVDLIDGRTLVVEHVPTTPAKEHIVTDQELIDALRQNADHHVAESQRLAEQAAHIEVERARHVAEAQRWQAALASALGELSSSNVAAPLTPVTRAARTTRKKKAAPRKTKPRTVTPSAHTNGNNGSAATIESIVLGALADRGAPLTLDEALATVKSVRPTTRNSVSQKVTQLVGQGRLIRATDRSTRFGLPAMKAALR